MLKLFLQQIVSYHLIFKLIELQQLLLFLIVLLFYIFDKNQAHIIFFLKLTVQWSKFNNFEFKNLFIMS